MWAAFSWVVLGICHSAPLLLLWPWHPPSPLPSWEPCSIGIGQDFLLPFNPFRALRVWGSRFLLSACPHASQSPGDRAGPWLPPAFTPLHWVCTTSWPLQAWSVPARKQGDSLPWTWFTPCPRYCFVVKHSQTIHSLPFSPSLEFNSPQSSLLGLVPGCWHENPFSPMHWKMHSFTSDSQSRQAQPVIWVCDQRGQQNSEFDRIVPSTGTSAWYFSGAGFFCFTHCQQQQQFWT